MKNCTLCWALFGQMAVCRWGCVWQMSPGGRWSRLPGERGRVCAGQIPADVWISVGVLDGASSGVACAQRDEMSHDAEQRYHGKRCVCVGVIQSIWSWTRSLFTNALVSGWYLFSHAGRNRKLSGFVGHCILVYIDSHSTAFVCISGEILHMPAPYTVTLKEKVFLFYLFASS